MRSAKTAKYRYKIQKKHRQIFLKTCHTVLKQNAWYNTKGQLEDRGGLWHYLVTYGTQTAGYES